MSTANEIILQLIEDLETYIDPSNGYNTDPTIKHGRFTHDQVEHEMPVLCVAETMLDSQEMFGDQGYGWVNLLIYGFARHDGYNDNDTLINLALDLLKFILVDFTYINDTEITSGIDLIPGGVNVPVSVLTLELRVKFDWTSSTINQQ